MALSWRFAPARGLLRAALLGCREAATPRCYVTASPASTSASARETMEYDVVIVGAGPAGLSAAIRLKQLSKLHNQDVSVCIIEKGAQVGAHVLSGNVFEPRALDELLPSWRGDPAVPVSVPVVKDYFYGLTQRHAVWLPTPPQMKNDGNYVISLSELTRWLAGRAEDAGVDIFPGFAGKNVLYSSDGAVAGVATNDFGVARNGSRKANFTPGVDLRARLTLFAEGCRGSLSELVIRRYGLREAAGADPQTYALGVKEVWQLPQHTPPPPSPPGSPDYSQTSASAASMSDAPGGGGDHRSRRHPSSSARHEPGHVFHTVGYPLDASTYGGGFLYTMSDRRIAVGLIVALDYRDPYLSPYDEFQRYKSHPLIASLLAGGTCLQYGARALNEGGLQSVPRLAFPGGALIGCAAGFLNVPKIKGSHTAMKSGMLAAEDAFEELTGRRPVAAAEAAAMAAEGRSAALWVGGSVAATTAAGATASSAPLPEAPLTVAAMTQSKAAGEAVRLTLYEAALRGGWVGDELRAARNVRPGFRLGLLGGLVYAAIDTYVFRGAAPWTLRSCSRPDHEQLELAKRHAPRQYPKPDGVLTFDIPTSLFRSGTNHDHDQPCHLQLTDPTAPERVQLPIYDGPEARYCPAGVYEYVDDDAKTGGSGDGEGRDGGGGGQRRSRRRQLRINAQNCLHCKACDIKDPGQNIVWTVPEGGGGPGYTMM